MKVTGKKKKNQARAYLPVSRDYIFPPPRKGMLLTGAMFSLFCLGYLLVDANLGRGSFIATGNVSSAHANLESNCTGCHDPGNAVTDQKCAACHEQTSALTIYDFPAHYIYQSSDPARISPAAQKKFAHKELPCAACHEEHRGRDASLTAVTDKKCLSCHKFDSFNTGHPQFEFARKASVDDSTLRMTHLRHTVFVLRELVKIDRLDSLFQKAKASARNGRMFFETACLYCHQPDADGKHFARINFEKHCSQCHIKADAIVAGLPVINRKRGSNIGVETITQMQKRGGPGLSWVYAMNPAVTPEEEGEVSKNPVYHEDPWIMENLKQIRRQLYPGDGLFEVLRTDANVLPSRVDTLYQEAIRTLQLRTDELKGRSELKRDLGKMNLLLQLVREKLRRPSPGRSRTAFAWPSQQNQHLSMAQRSEFQQLAVDLTAANGPECQKCHMLKNASIRRVQTEQSVLQRAKFNHRAHILEHGCIDCHKAIPVNEKLLRISVQNPPAFREKFPRIYRADRAATQNIPSIQNCRTCHAPDKVSNRCITCHTFHPNKLHRANLEWAASAASGG